MPYKCCVTGCVSNYADLKKHTSSLPRKSELSDDLPPTKRRKGISTHVPVFALPSDETERETWLKNIPRDNIPVTKYTRVCYKHWPKDFRNKKCQGGGIRPLDPPTVFENCDIPKSMIPTPCAPPRTTTRTSSSVRNSVPDQIDEYNAVMRVEFDSIIGTITQHVPSTDIVTYKNNGIVYVQSVDFCVGGVPKFLVKIFSDLSYEAYRSGVRCYINSLTGLKVYRLDDWGQIAEVIKYLKINKPPHKVSIIEEDIESLCNVKAVGQKVYSLQKVLRAFEYFATSRAAYKQFSNDYQLPSISMLQRLTSKCTSLSELQFIEKVLKNLPENQRQCNVLVDEIFVKPQLLYHGGQLFGTACNHPSQLATSVLAVMIVCLNGGPKFMAKLIPVTKLDGNYQFNIVKDIIRVITQSGGKTVSIISDDNKVNQKFMKMFHTHPNTPYVTVETENIPGYIFLLFDFVHIFKSIRNNWYTEKMKEISYHHSDMDFPQVAKWIDISEMFRLDSGQTVVPFAHKLTSVSIAPKPIERQNVAHMLKVFCDETVASLRTHPNLDRIAIEPTAKFIEMWTETWLILNVKQPHVHKRLNDPRRAEFRDVRDPRLDKLEKMAQMVEKMDSKNGKFLMKIAFIRLD